MDDFSTQTIAYGSVISSLTSSLQCLRGKKAIHLVQNYFLLLMNVSRCCIASAFGTSLCSEYGTTRATGTTILSPLGQHNWCDLQLISCHICGAPLRKAFGSRSSEVDRPSNSAQPTNAEDKDPGHPSRDSSSHALIM